MSNVIVLKQNSYKIRRKIEKVGINVCPCAWFQDSCWLDFHPRLKQNAVHGVGYTSEAEFPGWKQEDFLRHFEEDHKDDMTVCDTVEEFIEEIKNFKDYD